MVPFSVTMNDRSPRF